MNRLSILFLFLSSTLFAGQLSNQSQSIVALYHLNEGSGGVVFSAVNSTGIVPASITGATYVSGKFGTALNFTGTPDVVNTNATAEDIFGNNPDEWSVFCWVNTSSSGTSSAIVTDYNSGSGSDANFSYLITFNDGTTELNASIRKAAGGTVNYTILSQKEIRDGLWHLVGITVSKTKGRFRLWVDGELQGTNTSICTTCDYHDGTSTFIGAIRWNGGVTNFFVGKIDEVGYWQRELSSGEVQQMYIEGKGKYVSHNN